MTIARSILIVLGLLMALASGAYFAAPVAGYEPQCYLGSNLFKEPERRIFCHYSDEDVAAMIEGTTQEIESLQTQIVRMEKEFEEERFAMTERARLRREDTMFNEPERLTVARNQLIRFQGDLIPLEQEVKVRLAPVPQIIMGVGIGGIFLILLGIILPKLTPSGRQQGARTTMIKTGEVGFQSVEESIRADRFQSRVAAGFASRKEAETWLRSNEQMTDCSYCSKPLDLSDMGAVRHVKFIKEKPKDAKIDLRIELGESYYAILPDIRTCPHCGHKNARR